MEYIEDPLKLTELPAAVQAKIREGYEASETIIATLRKYYGTDDEKSRLIPCLFMPPTEKKWRVQESDAYEDDGNTRTPGRTIDCCYAWMLARHDNSLPVHMGSVWNGYADNCIAFTQEVAWRLRDNKIVRYGRDYFTVYFGGNRPDHNDKYQHRIGHTGHGNVLSPNTRLMTDLILRIDEFINVETIHNRLRFIGIST